MNTRETSSEKNKESDHVKKSVEELYKRFSSDDRTDLFDRKNYPPVIDVRNQDAHASVNVQGRVYEYLCAKARVNTAQLNNMFETIDNFMKKVDVGSEIFYYNKSYIVTAIIDRAKGVFKVGQDATGCGYVTNGFLVELTENNAWKQYSLEYRSNDQPINGSENVV